MPTDKQPRRFKLLKDLPYVKAGAIYIKDEYGNYRCEDGDFIYEITHDTLQSPVVESTPSWFAPVAPAVEEGKDGKLFQTCWFKTKEVNIIFNEPIEDYRKELVEYHIQKALTTPIRAANSSQEVNISDFIIGKRMYTQEEVDTIRRDTWLKCREFKDGTFIFDTNFKYKDLSDYLKSLEQPQQGKEFKGTIVVDSPISVNDTAPLQDKEQAWDILLWEHGQDGGTMALISGDIEGNLKAGHKIKSVKRRSDGEVFTVGDKVVWDWKESAFPEFTITGFRSFPDSLMMDCDHTTQNFEVCSKSNLRKSPPPTVLKDKVLFTTEDRVERSAGDVAWLLSTNNWRSCPTKVPENGKPFMGATGNEFKYFSSAEAAEQYILENKPCLSMNDVMDIVRTLGDCTTGSHNKSYINSMLHEKIKEKIKHYAPQERTKD